MPIHPSPSYHGYDVINYYAVNSEYGTLDDFRRLLEEAHNRDIRIIIDLVLNHTSTQHPWFQDANRNLESKYRDYYVWSQDGGNGWHQGQNGFYYAFFCDCMPDLNYNNPDVTIDMLKVTDYWLNEIGVDGFRVDAAKHLIEDGDVRENTPATHEWYKTFISLIRNKSLKPMQWAKYSVQVLLWSNRTLATSSTRSSILKCPPESSTASIGGANSGVDERDQVRTAGHARFQLCYLPHQP